MLEHADFGLHRIALFAARRPRFAWPVLICLLLLSAFGVSRLTTDASLTKAFHSGTPEYHTYQELTSTFPGSEHDVYVLVRGARLFDADALLALQDLHLELSLLDHVRSVASIFSLRKSVATGADPDSLIPLDLPASKEGLDALEHAVLTHPMARQWLVSPATQEGQLGVFAVSLDPGRDSAALRKALIDDISNTADAMLGAARIEFVIGGVPVARQELLAATETDAKVFSGLGFVVGLLIGAFVFRRWQFVIVASLCPLIGVAAGLGTIGLFDGRYSPFMNGIPPLIMAISFTDCMHLLFAIRRNARASMPMDEAIYKACAEVGPACGVASLTTAAALMSLALAPSPLVQEFGLWAAAAAVVAVCSVFLALPLICRLAFAGMTDFAGVSGTGSFASMAEGCRRIGRMVKSRSTELSVASLVLTVLFAAMYYLLEPRYRLSDQVPIEGSFRQVNKLLDGFLGGSTPVYVLVKWDRDAPPADDRISRAISAAHDVLQTQVPDRNVLSLKSLGSGFADQPDADTEQSTAAMKLFESDVKSRLLDRERAGALVSVLLPDIHADEMASFAQTLDRALDHLRQDHPGFSYVVTSLPVLLAVGSPSLISQINRSLIAAFVIVIAMLAVMFRSWRVGAISLLPNLLPVLMAGCVIYFVAGGLEYASVIALTVGFGLAVDDTAHFFNRLRIEYALNVPRSEPVIDALGHVGPILVITSVILVCGLAVTAFGELRTAFLFGTTCIAILAGALIADLVVLPAVLFAASSRLKMKLWH